LEKSDYQGVRIGETLPPIIQDLLQQLGVWAAFLATGPLEAHGTRACWGSEEPLDNEFPVPSSGPRLACSPRQVRRDACGGHSRRRSRLPWQYSRPVGGTAVRWLENRRRLWPENRVPLPGRRHGAQLDSSLEADLI